MVFLSIITILVTALVGSCYEFWLLYGQSKDCIYYKSDCQNTDKEGNGEASVIDYMFPNCLSYYPYQICKKGGSELSGGKKKQKGGGSFKSNYAATGSKRKCVTIRQDTDANEKVFPYNYAEYADREKMSATFAMPLKTFSFFFLYTVLIARMILNKIFSVLSEKYQDNIANKPILSNVMFLLMTGLLFPILGAFGVVGNGTATFGPMAIILSILTFVSMITNGSFTMFFGIIFSLIAQFMKINPKPISSLFYWLYQDKNNATDAHIKHHKLFDWKSMWYIYGEKEETNYPMWNYFKLILMDIIISFLVNMLFILLSF